MSATAVRYDPHFIDCIDEDSTVYRFEFSPVFGWTACKIRFYDPESRDERDNVLQ